MNQPNGSPRFAGNLEIRFCYSPSKTRRFLFSCEDFSLRTLPSLRHRLDLGIIADPKRFLLCVSAVSSFWLRIVGQNGRSRAMALFHFFRPAAQLRMTVIGVGSTSAGAVIFNRNRLSADTS